MHVIWYLSLIDKWWMIFEYIFSANDNWDPLIKYYTKNDGLITNCTEERYKPGLTICITKVFC